MFGFLFRKKRDIVRAVLTGHMNRFFLRQLHGEDRRVRRGMFCQVAWVIPYQDGKPRFQEAYPVVTRDICQEGIGLLTTHPIRDERLLVALEADVSMHFVNCLVQHSTPLGYGFYQIGLKPTEVLNVGTESLEQLRRRQEQFEHQRPPVLPDVEVNR